MCNGNAASDTPSELSHMGSQHPWCLASQLREASVPFVALLRADFWMDSDEYFIDAEMWILWGKFKKGILVLQNSSPKILQ